MTDSASVTMFCVTGGIRATVGSGMIGCERVSGRRVGRLLCWWVSWSAGAGHSPRGGSPGGPSAAGRGLQGLCLSGRSGAQRLDSARARPTWRRACSPRAAAPGSCSEGDVTGHLVRASAAVPLRRAAPVRTLQHTFTRNPSVLR